MEVSSRPASIALKRRLRTGIDHAARWTGVLRWLEARLTRGHTLLMYHRVLPEDQCRRYPLPTLAMPVGAFRQQVEFLAAHCEVVPVAEALTRSARRRAGARPLVSITFDDGYRDNRELAADVLEAAGIRATFFVATGFVESGEPLWFDRAIALLERASPELRERAARAHLSPAAAQPVCADEAPLVEWLSLLKHDACARIALLAALESEIGPIPPSDRFAALSPADVADLARRGHEIGSHTVTHPLLPELDDAELEFELTQSRRALERITGEPPTGFCYPNGDHDARVVDAVRRAGYRYACTVEAGINGPRDDPLYLRRLDITPDNTSSTGDRCDLVAFRSECCRLHEAWRS